MSTEELSLPECDLILLRDRARIAQDLHDHVIQLLFGTSLGLQNVAGTVEDPDLREHLSQAVVGINDAITQIRAVVFALSPGPSAGSGSARDVILALANQSTAGFGLAVTVTFGGPVDLIVTSRLLYDVCAVVRECLTNIVRHANASTVAMVLRVDDDAVGVTVEDDGVGIPHDGRRSGLGNLQARAARRGGTLVVESHPGHTSVAWVVPIPRVTTPECAPS